MSRLTKSTPHGREHRANHAILHIVLAESAIELVPEGLANHPVVIATAKKRKKKAHHLLLDDSMHHSAMKQAADKGRFEDLNRRGRPDIIHIATMVAQDARLNHDGRLRLWIHTRNDEVIEIAPECRPQRSQHRFYGLLETLYHDGRVPNDPSKSMLMQLHEMDLIGLVRRLEPSAIVALDEHGTDDDLAQALTRDVPDEGNVVVLIGGFPTGGFRTDLKELGSIAPVRNVALGSKPLTAWTVLAECVQAFHAATTKTS